MIVSLQQAYVCRYGVPSISAVDTDIFIKGYFGRCMECNFCHDACCRHGVDVTVLDRERIEAEAEQLEKYLEVPRHQWFTEEYDEDSDWPGGGATRSRVTDGACVFLNRNGRGCRLHQYALEQSRDVHEIKPMVCLLWPITWEKSVFYPSYEVDQNDLICVGVGEGISCYRSAREDLAYYFGSHLIEELDRHEAAAVEQVSQSKDAAAARPLAILPSLESSK